MVSDYLFKEIAAGEGETLSRAAKRFPRYRRNRPVNPATVFRWVVEGAPMIATGKRVRLEAARLAGRWITTPGAIQRFLAAQTPELNDASPVFKSASESKRRREADRAVKELHALH